MIFPFQKRVMFQVPAVHLQGFFSTQPKKMRVLNGSPAGGVFGFKGFFVIRGKATVLPVPRNPLMTLVLLGKGLVLEGCTFKNRDHWGSGYINTHLYLGCGPP